MSVKKKSVSVKINKTNIEGFTILYIPRKNK
jgi:hypothetical protein